MFWILLVCIGCTYFGWKEDVNSLIIATTFLNTIFIIINIWCFKNLVNSITAEKEIELFEKENTRINIKLFGRLRKMIKEDMEFLKKLQKEMLTQERRENEI